jgi:hypothetical protein
MAFSASSPVVRHKNRTGKDNPVSGAIMAFPIQFDDVAAGETVAYQWSPPAGMNVEIISADARCTAHTGTALLTVGTSAAGTQLVAPVTLTTTLGALTLKANSITPGSTLDVRIVAGGGEAVESASVTLVAYCSVPPDAAFLRNSDHF